MRLNMFLSQSSDQKGSVRRFSFDADLDWDGQISIEKHSNQAVCDVQPQVILKVWKTTIGT